MVQLLQLRWKGDGKFSQVESERFKGIFQLGKRRPALWFQSAANGSQREKGWRTVSRNKLLPEQLDIKAKIQCAWETVRVSINLAYDLGKNERSAQVQQQFQNVNKQETSASGRGSFKVLGCKGKSRNTVPLFQWG